MIRVAALFGLGFALTLLGTLAAERLARRGGLVTEPREDRWDPRSVPLLGGLAVMVGVVAPVLLAGSGVLRFAPLLLLALGVGAVGLFDDVRPIRPQAKLVAQIILAAVLIQLGAGLRVTPYPELNVALTLFWLVGLTNAFNLLDNMDGLAASLAAIAAAFRLAFFVMDGDLEGAGLMAAFIGAALGFLVRNFPPAKIFMGDAGSLFMGFFLSGACLMGRYAYSRGVTAVLILPVLLMLIPIFDTTFVTLTRFVTGRRVDRGGRDHTSHRLVGLGVTERQALAFLCAASVVSGLLAVASYQYGFSHTIVLMALLLVGLVLIGVHLSRVQIVVQGGASPAGAVIPLVADFPFKRQVATVAIDLVLILVAYYSAYLLRFEGAVESHRTIFLRTVGPVIILQVASLALFGSYQGLWRYTSLPEMLRLVKGATVGVGASVLYFVFAARFGSLSRAVFILDWLVLVMLLAGSRVSFRLLGELLRPARAQFRRVLIYGAGDGGELMLRELRNNPALEREPVGFLDDDRSKIGTRIHEVPVLGGFDRAAELLVAHRISEVIVSSAKIPGERMRALEALCAGRHVAVVRAVLRIE